MSRIGKATIDLPQNVEFDVSKGNLVKIKGPKGELFQQMDPSISVKLEDGVLTLDRASEQKRHKAMHGLYRSLLNNMIIGVTDGYKIKLELIGVGYRVSNRGSLLEVQVGYSHPIFFVLPDEVKLETAMEKGKAPSIMLESHDKQLVGQVAAKIRSFRKPEPYKGKGIKYANEILRRKAGKTAAK